MSFFALLETICASMAFALSFMAICLLALRRDPNGIYRPLIIFFSANAFIEAVSVLDAFPEYGYFENLSQIAEIISIPAFLLLAPALWLYVRGLTSETRLALTKSDGKHFIPFILGAIACSLLLFSPASIRNQIIGDGDGPDTAWIISITLMIVFIMLMWAAQVIIYIIALLHRISMYRTRLKDVFASTEGRELKWIVWMIVLLVATIFIMLPDLFISFSELIEFIPSVFNVILIWFLAIWGLRQMPGFIALGASELPVASDQTDNLSAFQSSATKYEKSALTENDTSRIAKKIEAAMEENQLFLDANLSLRLLAKHVSVQPNYVSQTLNGHIGETFFDYINRWRIDYAKPLLANSDETVLNITYDSGFNSRSSFYKAFKKETGKTPTAYRSFAKSKA
ncbi:helix-turn-helix domain-containing protein [Fretibacter rubidus]|uniref:helix-turn-helix domain-containing protein n=1 Tax=Fretibacter rubidus TaxID=570162 RepID=UPI00352A39BC